MPELDKKIKNDDRPRHVRAAEQVIQKGGCLRWDPQSGRGRLYTRKERISARLTRAQVEDVANGLPDEMTNAVIAVRDGLYADDGDGQRNAPANNESMTKEEQPMEDAVTDTETDTENDVDTCTTAELRSRFPQLERHYASVSKALYTVRMSGKLNFHKDGRHVIYHLDDDFYAWLSSLGIGEETAPEPTPGAEPEGPAREETAPEPEPQQPEPQQEPQGHRLPPHEIPSNAYGDGISPSDTIYVTVPGERSSVEDDIRRGFAELAQASVSGDLDDLTDTLSKAKQKLLQLTRSLDALEQARRVLAKS